jgi:CheY-like chemotaxis protein
LVAVDARRPSAPHNPDQRAKESLVVLVVEDEVLIRIDTAEELRQAGYTVLEAASADEALELLALGHAVDVIFSDVHMPGDLDGADLHDVVSEQYPSTTVILTSATTLPGPDREIGTWFIPKPYSLEAVLRLIDERARRDDGGSD